MARQPKPWFRKDRDAWYVTVNGRRHNLGPDRTDAFERFYELMSQPEEVAPVSSETFVAIADAFLEWSKNHRSPDTFEWYRYRIERFCQQYPTLKTRDIKPYHVQRWVDSYEHLSQTSRRNYVRSVKRCLAWARQQGYIDENPIQDMEVPGAERRELFLTTEQFQEVLSFIPDREFSELCIVAFETGCRPQEILRVEASHVDLENQRWVFKVRESKGKRMPRVVYLTPKSQEITRQLMAQFPTGKLFRNTQREPWTTESVNSAFCRLQHRMGKALASDRDLVITEREFKEVIKGLRPTKTVHGKLLEKSARELRQEARTKILKKRYSKLTPKLCLYVLRHSFATRALQSGLDSLTVALLMGHSDVSQVARTYQHLSHNPGHLIKELSRSVR